MLHLKLIDAHYNGFALLLRSSRVKPDSELQGEVFCIPRGHPRRQQALARRLGGSAIVNFLLSS